MFNTLEHIERQLEAGEDARAASSAATNAAGLSRAPLAASSDRCKRAKPTEDRNARAIIG